MTDLGCPEIKRFADPDSTRDTLQQPTKSLAQPRSEDQQPTQPLGHSASNLNTSQPTPKPLVTIQLPADTNPLTEAINRAMTRSVNASFLHTQLSELTGLTERGHMWKVIYDAIRTSEKNSIDLNQPDDDGRCVIRAAAVIDCFYFQPGFPILTESLMERCGFVFNLGTLFQDVAETIPRMVLDAAGRQHSTAHYQRGCRILALLMRHPDCRVNAFTQVKDNPISLLPPPPPPDADPVDPAAGVPGPVIPHERLGPSSKPAIVSLLSTHCEELQAFCLVRAALRMLFAHPSFRADEKYLNTAHAGEVFCLMHPRWKTRRYIAHEKLSFAGEVLTELLRHGFSSNRMLPVSPDKLNKRLPVLYLAVARDYPPDVVSLLIQHKAQLNYQDQLGNSLLHVAVAKENANALRVLIIEGVPHGLDLFAIDAHGRTALDVALINSRFNKLVADPLVDVLLAAQQAVEPLAEMVIQFMVPYLGPTISQMVMDTLQGNYIVGRKQEYANTKHAGLKRLAAEEPARGIDTPQVCEIDADESDLSESGGDEDEAVDDEDMNPPPPPPPPVVTTFTVPLTQPESAANMAPSPAKRRKPTPPLSMNDRTSDL